jgi:Fe-S-cluster containining protein
MPDGTDLAAGEFSTWIAELQAAIRGERDSDVPCDGCTACCTSSQFVHIGPEEAETLARVPAELLFPAPGRPLGHVLMGYDERGHCPMLIDDECTIYEHRPQACRTYDCRVFPAAGVEIDDADKALIAGRARRWQFSYPTGADRTTHEAVRAAASFLAEQGDLNETRLAVLAVEIHGAFLARDDATGNVTVTEPDPAAVRVEITRRGVRGRIGR